MGIGKIRKTNECHSNMPQPSCICTVLLKLAKVEWLKIRKCWVHVLFILKGWQAAIDCDLPHHDSVHDFYTLMVVSANFQQSNNVASGLNQHPLLSSKMDKMLACFE